MTAKQVDVVVVGGGIVGAVQALLLAKNGVTVLLVEASSADSVTEHQHEPMLEPLHEHLQPRSVALSYRSYELLAAEGLWPSDATCPISEIHVTDKGSFGSARITARDLNTTALGYVVANHSFERHLGRLVQAQENIELVQPAKATLTQNSVNGVELNVSRACGEADSSAPGLNAQADESTAEARDIKVRCKLLIAADGTHSNIRQWLGLKLKQRDYQQVALVANVECQLDHQHIAHERFTESGPLALLPLAPRCMAMVYTARECDGEALKSMSDADFLQLLQVRFGGKLGRFKAVGRRAIFPLALSESESQTSGSCVLIGNSARTLHPVAGQGLNLALRDVFALAASVAHLLGSEAMPASEQQSVDSSAAGRTTELSQVLSDFERQRRLDQRSTVRRTDLLARVFSGHTLPAMGPLRGASLVLLDGLAPLRKRFAAESAGIGVPLGISGSGHTN